MRYIIHILLPQLIRIIQGDNWYTHHCHLFFFFFIIMLYCYWTRSYTHNAFFYHYPLMHISWIPSIKAGNFGLDFACFRFRFHFLWYWLLFVLRPTFPYYFCVEKSWKITSSIHSWVDMNLKYFKTGHISVSCHIWSI